MKRIDKIKLLQAVNSGEIIQEDVVLITEPQCHLFIKKGNVYTGPNDKVYSESEYLEFKERATKLNELNICWVEELTY